MDHFFLVVGHVGVRSDDRILELIDVHEAIQQKSLEIFAARLLLLCYLQDDK